MSRFSTRAHRCVLSSFLLSLTACIVLGSQTAWATVTVYDDYFSWRNLNGANYLTDSRAQGSAGTCGAFGAVGVTEAWYKITRNDTVAFADDVWCSNLSEQNIVNYVYTYVDLARPPIAQLGVNPSNALRDQLATFPSDSMGRSTGIVPETDIPYTAYYPPDDWSLDASLLNRRLHLAGGTDANGAYVARANFSPESTMAMKAALLANGPLTVCRSGVVGPHVEVIYGWNDTAINPHTGETGFFLLKNSNSAAGYWDGPMNYLDYSEGGDAVCKASGPAYFNGWLNSSVWNGGSGNWNVSATNWTRGQGDDGQLHGAGGTNTWLNGETKASFGPNLLGYGGTVTIDGDSRISTYGITIQPNVSNGYTFDGINGGELTITGYHNDPTVTGGGINTQSNATFTANTSITVGAPSAWTVATGKTLTVNGPINLHISTLTITGTGNTALNGAISDISGNTATFGGLLAGYSGGLTKEGTGTLTLGSANTYRGDTTLNAGVLAFSNSDTLQYSTLVYNGGTLSRSGAALTALNLGGLGGTQNLAMPSGTLSIGSNNADTVYSGTLSGGQASTVLKKLGTGRLALLGTNTYAGTKTQVLGGTLRADDGVGLPSGTNLELNNAVLETGASFSRLLGTATGRVQLTGGTGGFLADGTATVNLDNGNAITLGTGYFQPTTLVLGSSENGNLVFANSLNLNGRERTISTPNGLATLSGSLTASAGTLTKTGEGILAVTANNSGYYGMTNVLEGTLRADANTLLGGNLTLGGGILENQTSGGTLTRTLGSNNGQIRLTDDYAGFSANGTGTFHLNSGGSATWGGASFDAQSLVLDPKDGTLTVNFADGIGLDAGMHEVSVPAGIATLAGNLSGTGGLTKNDGGTMVLTGTSSYSGGTTINNGAIRASAAANFGSGGTIAFDGGAIQFGANFDLSSHSTKFDTHGATLDANGLTVTLSNPLNTAGGTGTLTVKTGAGNMRFHGSSTIAGGVVLNGTHSLTIGGSNGLISAGASTDPVIQATNGAALVFDNTSANPGFNRIQGSGGVLLADSELKMLSNYTETQTVSKIRTQGQVTLSVAATGPMNTATLNFTDDPNASRDTSTMLIRGQNLGLTSTPRGRVKSTAGMMTTNQGSGTEIGVLPYAIGDISATGSGRGLVTYDVTNGVRLLTSQEYVSDINTAGTTTHNVKLASSGTLSASKTQRSLTLAGTSPVTVTLGANLLTLDSAAIVSGTSTAGPANTITGGSLTLANANFLNLSIHEGFIHTISDLTIDSTIVNPQGDNVMQLIKGGPGKLILTGANTYGGTVRPVAGTTLNTGTLVIANSAASATGEGAVTLNGGVFASMSGENDLCAGIVQGSAGLHTISPGGDATCGTMTLMGGLGLTSYSTINFDYDYVRGTWDKIVVSDGISFGPATIDVNGFETGGTYELIDFDSIIGSDFAGLELNDYLHLTGASAGSCLTMDADSLNLVIPSGFQGMGMTQAVPEPSTLVLFGVAALGLMAYIRQRTRR